jgi:alpha-ribazole phosphatase
MAQIYLVRHTKVAVQQGICYGQTDVELAPTYPEEFAKIMEKLSGKKFNIVYSSPLERCTRLAEYIAPDLFMKDARLKELHFGDWEMQSWNEIYETPYGKEWMDNYFSLRCPGGESYPDLYKRVSEFIHELSPAEDVLVITHSGVLRVFLSIFQNISLQEIFDYKIDFGDVVVIDL